MCIDRYTCSDVRLQSFWVYITNYKKVRVRIFFGKQYKQSNCIVLYCIMRPYTDGIPLELSEMRTPPG